MPGIWLCMTDADVLDLLLTLQSAGSAKAAPGASVYAAGSVELHAQYICVADTQTECVDSAWLVPNGMQFLAGEWYVVSSGPLLDALRGSSSMHLTGKLSVENVSGIRAVFWNTSSPAVPATHAVRNTAGQLVNQLAIEAYTPYFVHAVTSS